MSESHSFIDAGGHEWQIKFTAGLLDQVEKAAGLNLLPEDRDVSALVGLLFKPRKLCAVLWALCIDEAQSRSIDRSKFFDELDGAALSRGWQAIADEAIYFTDCLRPGMGAAIQECIEAEMILVEASTKRICDALNSPEVGEAISSAAKKVGEEMQADLVRRLDEFGRQ